MEKNVALRSHGRVRFLLASAPHADTFGYSMPPPGLTRLGGELARLNIPVVLEDLAFRLASGALPADDHLADSAADLLLASGAPDVLGLSVMGATLPIALAIARRVRARAAETSIVLGGPGTTGVDRVVLERFPWIDAVVRGEGEVTLPELLGRFAAGRELAGVRGTTWRDAAGAVHREDDRPPIQDLSALAPYAWELLPPLAEYKRITGEDEGLTPIDSGRGCVYDCTFCTIGRFWNRRSRPLPAERLADEVAAIQDIPGAKSAYLCHDIFGADRPHAVAFCEAMIRREIDVPWECRGRADHLDAELLALMGRAGCHRVLLGIESADPGVRARCQKGMRPDIDLLAVVDHCAAAGITPILSLILGLPGEDEAALARSLDFCADAALRAGVNVSLHMVNPQPGCGLGEELGPRSRPIAGIPPDMALGAGTTAAERELIELHPDIFSTWALLPQTEERAFDLHAIATALPEVLMRYPRTFGALRRCAGEGSDMGGDTAAGMGSTPPQGAPERSRGIPPPPPPPVDRPGSAAVARPMPRASALAVYRAWRRTGRSFEAFALASRDGLVRDLLAWEQAIVRAGARGMGAENGCDGSTPGAVPRARAEVVRADHDLPAVARSLLAGEPLPGPSSPATCLAVAAEGRRVATLRVSADVEAVLALLDGRPLAELEAEHPGIAAALTRLVDAGLVAFARPLEFSPSPTHAVSPALRAP
ncbi:MAG: B12-binding domain-containing radical SAM protein [Planctomycetota bacterium]|nr:MAG: B12-binding domain-containing radical SAM protein [Planctomycetota bacterium]